MARRGQGEGSIRLRSPGKWEGRITVGRDTMGRQKRKSVYGSSRAEVQKKVAQALRALEQGLPQVDEQLTVEVHARRWLDESVKPRVRPATYVRYRGLIEMYIIPYLGKERVARLTPDQVQSFLNRLSDGPLSPRSVQHVHSVLRGALQQALRWGYVQRNVAQLVTPPPAVRPEVKPFDPDEARALLKAVQGDRLEALYTSALALGMRRGELLGLLWEDVDLDAGVLRVRRALQRQDGRLRLVEPKSRSSNRTLAIPAIALLALREHRKRQLLERVAAGPDWQEGDFVFTTTKGTAVDPDNLSRYFKRLLVRAGLRPLRFHDLRHSCATLLLVQGVHPRAVMEVLGHSQIAVTMNTYSHVLPEVKRAAAEQMDALLTNRAAE